MRQRIDETRNMLNTIRHMINEEETVEQPNSKGAIAITDDPKFGQQVLSSQIEEFKAFYMQQCSQARIDYVPLSTNMPFDKALTKYLLSRKGR